MLSVACVLRSGGEYKGESVEALLRGVRDNLDVEHQVYCLTDVPGQLPSGCVPIPLERGWPGWWSKLELFRPGALPPGPKLYLDLDTIVVRDISKIVLGHHFTVLTNFWADERIGSGLMAWDTVAVNEIYRAFTRDPDRHMAEYTTTEKWGDQGFIRFNSPIRPDRWQDLHPGKVVSFKRHCVPAARVPDGAAIVCFHGKPRPWQLNTFQRRWFNNARHLRAAV